MTMHPHRLHAKARMQERFGCDLNRYLLREMREHIHEGRAELVCRESNTRTVWRMRVRDLDVMAVYSNRTHQIVTVWRPDAGGARGAL